jgi:crotonobetainyl-CoA:carnitine CoA-transferase CaiB-like acyl-CoA transferase
VADSLAALRDRTGEGTRVDVGILDTALLMNDLPTAYESFAGEPWAGAGTHRSRHGDRSAPPTAT